MKKSINLKGRIFILYQIGEVKMNRKTKILTASKDPFTGNETLIIPDIPEKELEIKPPWSE